MIYLASPYSGTRDEESRRYFAAMKATANLLRKGKAVYSPIVHCHNMAIMYNLPKDFEFWRWYNEEMMKVAKEIYVLRIDGWKESMGVASEILYADMSKKPVVFIDG